jgi:hypothetical protein
MDDKLWIRIIDGQIQEGAHPAYESNLLLAFPELNGNFTGHFAPVDYQPVPMIAADEELEGPFYRFEGDVVVNYYNVKKIS